MREEFRKLREEISRNKYLIIALAIIAALLFFLTIPAEAQASEPATHIYAYCEASEIITALSEINHSIEEATLGMMASLLWIVGLVSFSLGISVMTIFAIIWGRNK